MPRVRHTIPQEPSRNKGERNLDAPIFLNRYVPFWGNPGWIDAQTWRNFVNLQPLLLVCRDTLIANLLSLDWKIEPSDSTQRDELKTEIDYYTEFFTDTGEYSFEEIIEWVGKDALDLPFGGAAEVGHEGDSPEGKVLWLRPLDGGTLFPTLDMDWPVGQKVPETTFLPVIFPKHAIDRIYFSPRTELRREGWGIAPPEKIYLAGELLIRGDKYYANLLLDTPQVGILDLIDMSKDGATEWVQAWRTMLTGIDPFKIPVLYEHEKKAEWIPFTRSPVEIMFDKALYRYGALATAGYGMTLSDIGLGGGVGSGGETLAGSIREERKTRRTGFAVFKKKMRAFFNRMLPTTLRFTFIDLDDEMSVAMGRAMLAQATAFNAMITAGMFTAEEARQQIIANGLITITIPEELPPEAKKMVDMKLNPPERPSMLGRPVSPGQGGWGEAAAKAEIERMLEDE